MATSTRDFLATGTLPQYETVRLAMLVAGVSRFEVLQGRDLSDTEARRLKSLVDKRASGVPLQHLEGVVQFGPIDVLCDSRALVPRPETEYLWELVVERVSGRRVDVVVDLCTGGGCLALALKHELPAARVIGTDVDSSAVSLASDNATFTGIEIEVREGDLFEALPKEIFGQVDLLVVNPPYVAESEFGSLPIDVRAYDPKVALVAGDTGLEIIERIAVDWEAWMRSSGLLALEIGEHQGAAVRELFPGGDTELVPDLAGRTRFFFAYAQ